ncbi:MAG: mechanosensitive ion channel [Bergeyella sp.]
MNKDVKKLSDILLDSWNNFLETLPALVVAIIVAFIGFFIIKYLSKISRKIIVNRSKDTLVSDFLVNLVSIVLAIFLIVICLSIIGWGSITDKILAGAGITTFVIGFALKDIGENFLAGIIMAFRHPFRVGDLIEVNGIKGIVQKMALRETSVKTIDGIDVYIPNSSIIKNPLKNFTIDTLLMNEFDLAVEYRNDVNKLIPILFNTLKEFPYILKNPEPKVYIKDISGGSVQIKVEYWFKVNEVKPSASELRSDIILKCFQVANEKGYSLPSGAVDVKIVETTEEPQQESESGNEEESEG